MADDDFCYLTTTGRVSGRPHEIEIWYARVNDTLYLMAGGGHTSDWVRNLVADARCSVRIDGEIRAATARILEVVDSAGTAAGSGDDRAIAHEADRAGTLVFDKYQARYSGDLTDWRGRALPVAIDLMQPV